MTYLRLSDMLYRMQLINVIPISKGVSKETLTYYSANPIKEAEDCGVGEILLTSMDADGTQAGVDLEITRMISDMVSIPVIASGGIGSLDHFKDAFNIGKADAVLAASVFHRDIIPIQKVKKYLTENDIQVR